MTTANAPSGFPSLVPNIGGLDTAKVAGLLVVGAVVTLGVLRKSFGGVRVSIGN